MNNTNDWSYNGPEYDWGYREGYSDGYSSGIQEFINLQQVIFSIFIGYKNLYISDTDQKYENVINSILEHAKNLHPIEDFDFEDL